MQGGREERPPGPRASGRDRTVEDWILTLEKASAALAGALEGYRERIHDERLGETLGEAARAARETRDSVREAGREVAEQPELSRLGHATRERASHARDVTTGAVRGAGESVRGTAAGAGESVRSTASDVAGTVRETAAEARRATAESYHRAEERVGETVRDVRRKGAAVSETGRRATRAPGAIMSDVGRGVSEMASRFGRAFGMYAVTGLFGLTAFILLTIFLVVALNGVLGNPWGTLVVTVLWAIVAGIGIMMAKRYVDQAAHARVEMRDRVREDIDYVKRPVRREFGAGRGM